MKDMKLLRSIYFDTSSERPMMEDGKEDHHYGFINNNQAEVKEPTNAESCDNYLNVNGGGNSFKKLADIKLSSNCFGQANHKSANDRTGTKNKVTEQTTISPAKPIPKPLIIKQSTFKPIAKRSGEEARHSNKLFKENGNFPAQPQPPSRDEHIDEDALQKAILKLHSTPTSKGRQKSHQSCKKRRVDGNGDSAQFLVLQPALKFKCAKCSHTFPSLVMLKHHQRTCTHLPKTPTPPTSLPPVQKSPQPQASGDTNLRFTRNVYLCSACGTYYENWNLFLHIREVHNRHTCLFCFGMFSQAHKLASHLVIKHNIQEDYFASKEDLTCKFSESLYLLCCKCEKVFTERDNFILHECSSVAKPCSVCKGKGTHASHCCKVVKLRKPPHAGTGADPQAVECKPRPPNTSDGKTVLSKVKTESNSDAVNGSSVCEPPGTASPECDKDKCISPSGATVCKDSSEPAGHSASVTSCDTANSHPSENDNVHSATVQPKHSPGLATSHSSPGKQPPTDIQPLPPNTLENMDSWTASSDEMDKSYTSQHMPASEPTTPAAATETLYQIHPSVSWPRKPQFLSKPPPRNRRPPKRYQNSDSPEESSHLQHSPYHPLAYTPTAQPLFYESPEPKVVKAVTPERENKMTVPKLTVKIPKTVLQKQSTSDYSSESEDSEKLTVVDVEATGGDSVPEGHPVALNHVTGDAPQDMECQPTTPITNNVNSNLNSSDVDIVLAGEEVAVTELTLDHPLDRYTLQELLKVFLASTVSSCIYCNHARKIAVNGKQLAIHFISQHRFSATVDSITAEELQPDTIVEKMRSSLDQVQSFYLNLEGFDTEDNSNMKLFDQTLECFQCYYVTPLQKELYSHNRKMHQKTIFLCIMCKSNFYSYSELLCHLCPGTYLPTNDISFRCCLCPKDSMPSAFRLMVHLRKSHNCCDVCLEHCHNQTRLSNHVWKHKLHHLCYRCGIAYRNKPDITKHLFWKHGTESVLCKKCLQKRWPHVYHFCTPPATFICEECNSSFTRAVSLKVHKRLHANDTPYACTQEGCQDKFISKKLLAKHETKHSESQDTSEALPKQTATPVSDNNDIIVIDDKPDDVIEVVDDADTKHTPKPKKVKKSKKAKDNKDNLLIDVNLPALNLSESDSSEESEVEATKVNESTNHEAAQPAAAPSEPSATVESRADTVEEVKPENTVPDVWDNFKMYQAQREMEAVSHLPPKPKHVCDSDHDYCVIPLTDYEHIEEQLRLQAEGLSPTKDGKKKSKSKKKAKKDECSSSSDSSSDSDSSCSCGSNCSCSSSSGSSSSSSSSSDSELDSSPKQISKTQTSLKTKTHKDSDASALDVVTPPAEPAELPIAETDLDTDETETDEEFYDEHPQLLANKVLAEKRNKLLLLAAVAPSVNNGSYVDSSRPVTPELVESVPHEPKKKIKNKKKRRTKVKAGPVVPPIKIPIKITQPEPASPAVLNKITISLQTNSVIDKFGKNSPKMMVSTPNSDVDSKRASKRRRVPNKFYGYSSDEEYIQNQKLPPKLEWRKEDLPSSSGYHPQPPVIPDYSKIKDIVLAHDPKPVVATPLVSQEPVYSSSDYNNDSDSSGEGVLQINEPIAEPVVEHVVNNRLYNHHYGAGIPFPRPAGAREAKEGESVYCYCRCPYDEVSEMIACDADGCAIEWFHFECVGIMVPPKGKWFCPDCRQKDEYFNQM